MYKQGKQLPKREQILNLKQQGLSPIEISKKLGIPASAIRYHYDPERRERMREYRNRPEVREREREYKHRPEVRERMREYCRRKGLLIDVFKDFETGYTFEDLREKVGGKPYALRRDIECYLELELLLMTVENGVKVYRLNSDSPFHKVADGFYEREEKRLFREI